MVGEQRWYKTPNGNFYPSITTVLGIKEKPGLEAWRESMGHEAAEIETARAAARGEAVHLMCERALNNDPDPIHDQTEANIKLFRQLKFSLKRIANIRMQEMALFSDTLTVAGRVDVIAEYEGIPSVIDFKTSNNNKSNELVGDYFLQETFYAIAYTQLYHEPINQIVTLMAVERGGLPMVWKRDIKQYIVPLCERIDLFYQSL